MGKYYNTHTVPLVDYVVDFPFDSLLKAKVYKQERADKTQDLLSEEKKKLLGMKVIGGKQVQQPDGTMVYEKSDDEIYRDNKVEEYNTLIESMRGKDLSSNYGLIKQKLDDIWDPHMVDIASSRAAYDEEQKQIQKWRSEGKIVKEIDPRGWSTEQQGQYTAQNRPWVSWQAQAKEIFNDLEPNVGPDGMMQNEEIDQNRIRERSRDNAKTFRVTPAGQQMVADWMEGNAVLVNNWKTQGMDDLQILDKAAEEALFNTGMEKVYQKITPYGKGKGPGGGGGDSDFVPEGYYLSLIDEMVRNEKHTTSVPANKGLAAIIGVTPRKTGTVGEVYTLANERGAVIGDRHQKNSLPYYGIGSSGVMGRLAVGDFDQALNREVTPEDVFTQQEALRLLAEYRNKANEIEGWEEYQEAKKKLEQAANKRYLDLLKISVAPEFNREEGELTALDKSNQMIILNALASGVHPSSLLRGTSTSIPGSKAKPGIGGIIIPHDIYYEDDYKTGDGKRTKHDRGGPGFGPLYDADGNVRRQADGKELWGKQIKFEKGFELGTREYGSVSPAGKALIGADIRTLGQAKQLLQSIGKWDYALERKMLLDDPEKVLDATYQEAIDKHQAVKDRYMDAGMYNPAGSDARDILKAQSEHDDNSNEAHLARSYIKAVKAEAVLGKGVYDFKPDAVENYFLANGNAYISGTMYITEQQLHNMAPQGIKDQEGNLVVEGASGEGNEGFPWIWGIEGKPFQINLEQALLESGLMQKVTTTNDKGEDVALYAIPLNIKRRISDNVQMNYNREVGLGDKYLQGSNELDKKKLAATLLQGSQNAVIEADKAYADGYENRLLFKYNQAFDMMVNYPPGSKQLKALFDSGKPEDVEKATSANSGVAVFDSLIKNYEDVLNKANKEEWDGSAQVSEMFTPYLEVIRKFKDGGMRGPDQLGNVQKAYRKLAEMYTEFIDPRGYAGVPTQGGATVKKGMREQEIKNNFNEYFNRDILDPKIEEAIVAKDWDAYAKYGKEKAISQGMEKIENFGNINVSNNAYVPYTSPTMKNFIGTINNALKQKITISGLFRTPELNKNLDGSAENSLHMSGLAMDVSLNTNKEGADELEALIEAGVIKAPDGYRIDRTRHGKGSNYHLHLELEPIS